MAEATMTSGGPHLFGLAKIDDADTLHQAMHGWWPRMEEPQPRRVLAGVDAYGEGFCLDQDIESQVRGLAYPVHVINAVTLPAHQVMPASEAKPYRR